MAAGVGLLVGAGTMALAGVAGGSVSAANPDHAAIEQIVHDYILAHPEIIPQAIAKLQDRQMAQTIDANRKAIETPFAGAWAGARDGDVTLVEFFDYACGFCRASMPDVDRLLAEDPKLRIVFRELPILGDESDDAAKVSLAAAQQNRFMAFHRSMYAGDRPGKESIARAQAASGLDPRGVAQARSSAEVRDEIARNLELARTLNLTGTPSFIIGDKVLSGAVGYDELKKAVAEARAKSAG